VPAHDGPAPDFIPPAAVRPLAMRRAPEFVPPDTVPPEPARTAPDVP